MSLRHASIFSQVLSVVSRQEFGRAVQETKAERGLRDLQAGTSLWP